MWSARVRYIPSEVGLRRCTTDALLVPKAVYRSLRRMGHHVPGIQLRDVNAHDILAISKIDRCNDHP